MILSVCCTYIQGALEKMHCIASLVVAYKKSKGDLIVNTNILCAQCIVLKKYFFPEHPVHQHDFFALLTFEPFLHFMLDIIDYHRY